MVVLPLPDGPTRAVTVLGFALMQMLYNGDYFFGVDLNLIDLHSLSISE